MKCTCAELGKLIRDADLLRFSLQLQFGKLSFFIDRFTFTAQHHPVSTAHRRR